MNDFLNPTKIIKDIENEMNDKYLNKILFDFNKEIPNDDDKLAELEQILIKATENHDVITFTNAIRVIFNKYLEYIKLIDTSKEINIKKIQDKYGTDGKSKSGKDIRDSFTDIGKFENYLEFGSHFFTHMDRISNKIIKQGNDFFVLYYVNEILRSISDILNLDYKDKVFVLSPIEERLALINLRIMDKEIYTTPNEFIKSISNVIELIISFIKDDPRSKDSVSIPYYNIFRSHLNNYEQLCKKALDNSTITIKDREKTRIIKEREF